MSKVLVLGACGAMGRYLVPLLAERSFEVHAVDMKITEKTSPGIKYMQGNAKDGTFLRELFRENSYDAIIDFLVHPTSELPIFIPRFLDATSQYLYVSSGRIYDNKEIPVKETSPRLLDSSRDPYLIASDDYCIYKARGEDLIHAIGTKKNWTILRPATTYSFMRYQLVTLEAHDTVGRARMGKLVVLPEQARKKPATLSWGGDAAKMIAGLVLNEKALGEAYNINSSEHRTWEEIEGYYKDICNLKALWVDKEDYIKIFQPDPYIFGARWQLEYARLFDRIVDNSKVLAHTGLKQEDMMPLYDGLKMEISRCPADQEWKVNDRMDAYLRERGIC